MEFKQNRKAVANARKVLKAMGVNSLLAAPESNPKVAKNGKVGILAAPLHLAPANLSGYEVCPQRSLGCTKACLHTAGNPAYMANKEKARIARTKAYFEARTEFMTVLIAEITSHVRKAKSAGMIAGIRLNATSDIPWERVAITRAMIHGPEVGYPKDMIARNVMELFPEVEFYDYTKVTKRALHHANPDHHWPSNYHLTFSATEDNHSDVQRVLKAGGNVAMVFHGNKLPDSWDGFPVHDGDEHDFRPNDPKGVIVGLRAKGDARKDTSGFVRIVA